MKPRPTHPGPLRAAAPALALLLAACASSGGGAGEPVEARARRIAREQLIVDTHIDVPYRLQSQDPPRDDVAQRTEGGHFDAVRAREGGLDAAFFSIYVPASYQETGGAKAFADASIDLVEELVAAAPETFGLATSPADVRRIAGEGRIAIALGIENGAAIEDDVANLRHFAARGVRYVTLAHSENNLLCDSSYASARRWNGLSPLGREAVLELNRLGVLVDVSHVSDATFDQVLALSKAPVIASHSSCRRFTPGFERNLDDGRIALLAARGGVIQINFGSAFLTEAANRAAFQGREELRRALADSGLAPRSEEARAFRRRWREEHPMPEVTVADVADHLDHAVSIAGFDHVGIGSDYDGVSDVPRGLEDVSRYPALVEELLRRGWTEDDVAKVLGLNLLRVWEDAERLAAELRAR